MRDRDLSDLLSPILVKEVRQGVRGQVFSGSCLLLQVLMLLVMAVALTEGEGDERFEFGLDLLLRGIASTVK